MRTGHLKPIQGNSAQAECIIRAAESCRMSVCGSFLLKSIVIWVSYRWAIKEASVSSWKIQKSPLPVNTICFPTVADTGFRKVTHAMAKVVAVLLIFFLNFLSPIYLHQKAKTLLYLLSLSVTWTRWLLRTHYDRKAVFLLTLFSIPAPGNRHSRSIPRHGVRTSHSLICQHQVKNRPVRVLEIEQPFGTHNLADSINTIFQHSLKKCCAEGCYHKTKQKKSQTCG